MLRRRSFVAVIAALFVFATPATANCPRGMGKVRQRRDPLQVYLSQIREIPPMTPEDIERLMPVIQSGVAAAARLRAGTFEPDEKAGLERAVADAQRARNRLVEGHLTMVAYRVRLHAGIRDSYLDFEDAVQEGNIALLNAAESYRPETGKSFDTYASAAIRNQVRRQILTGTRMIGLRRRQTEYIAEWFNAEKALSEELGRAVTQEEVQQRLEWDEEDMSKISDALRVSRTYAQRDESERRNLFDVMGPDPHFPLTAAIAKEEKEMVRQIVYEQLPRKARDVLIARFGLDGNEPQTLEQIAHSMGVTKQAVNYQEQKGIAIVAAVWQLGRVQR